MLCLRGAGQAGGGCGVSVGFHGTALKLTDDVRTTVNILHEVRSVHYISVELGLKGEAGRAAVWATC